VLFVEIEGASEIGIKSRKFSLLKAFTNFPALSIRVRKIFLIFSRNGVLVPGITLSGLTRGTFRTGDWLANGLSDGLGEAVGGAEVSAGEGVGSA
jgi:hypothetical protein